jgi:protoporphyrinogen oxidase
MSQQRIAVIGAGPMGLAVAYQLAKDGHQPVVFEADDRVGGMTACFDFNGLKIERYYHFHCISDRAFLELLAELGISEKMHWVETKMGYWYQGNVQPWGNPLALLTFKGLSFTAKLRYGLHAFLATKRKSWKTLDSMDAQTWIKRWVGNEAYDVLWRKLFEFKFYELSNNLSAAWIWSRIRRIGTSRYSLFREKLGYLDGGSDTLLSALKKSIESLGGEINLKSPVNKVIIENGRAIGVLVNGKQTNFDKVVFTAPLPYVPKIIPDLPREVLLKLSNLKNIAVVCVIVKLRKQVTKNFWLNTNDPDMDIPGLVEYSNLRPLDCNVVYVPFYMPGDNPKFADSDQVFIDKVKRYLMKINNEIVDTDFIDAKASRYKHAQPICPPDYLQQLPTLSPGIEGLWVADTSYYYPEDRGISESIGFGRNLARIIIQ